MFRDARKVRKNRRIERDVCIVGAGAAGITIALEPMVLIGTPRTTVQDDKWTVTSADNTLTAHFEHSVAVMDGEPLILTELQPQEVT